MKWAKVKGEKGRGFAWNSLSCDRINPRGGYTKRNVRFVLNIMNLFHNDGPDSRMYRLAEAFLRHRKEVPNVHAHDQDALR